MFYHSLKDNKAPKEPKGRSLQLKKNTLNVQVLRRKRMFHHFLKDNKVPKEPKNCSLQLNTNSFAIKV